MSSVRSNNLSLKYQRLTLLSCSDIRIRKFYIVGGRFNPTRLEINDEDHNSVNVFRHFMIQGVPKKHGNSVTNSILSLLWISIVIPNFKVIILLCLLDLFYENGKWL